MNRDDVIRIAREADEGHAGMECEQFGGGIVSVSTLERFAALVAAAEREACAKGCDDAALGFGEETSWAQGYVQGIRDVADGIRARDDQ